MSKQSKKAKKKERKEARKQELAMNKESAIVSIKPANKHAVPPNKVDDKSESLEDFGGPKAMTKS